MTRNATSSRLVHHQDSNDHASSHNHFFADRRTVEKGAPSTSSPTLPQPSETPINESAETRLATTSSKISSEHEGVSRTSPHDSTFALDSENVFLPVFSQYNEQWSRSPSLLASDGMIEEEIMIDDAQAVGFRTPAKLRSLHERRLRMSGLRYGARELREKRRLWLQELEDVMSELLEYVANVRLSEEFARKLYQMEEYRTEFQAADMNYDALEEVLLQEEWDLKEAESAFYGHEIAMLEPPAFVRGYAANNAQHQESMSANPTEYQDERPEGMARSAKDQLTELCSERLSILAELRNLVTDYEALSFERDIRSSFNMRLDDEAGRFISTFCFREGHLKDELISLERRIAWLRELQHQDGALFFGFDYFSHTTDPKSTIEKDSLLEEAVILGRGTRDSVNAKVRALLLPLGDRSSMDLFSNSGPIAIRISLSYSIDQWLLYDLLHSSWSSFQYVVWSEDTLRHFRGDALKDLLLQLWFRDGASAGVVISRWESNNLSIRSRTTKSPRPRQPGVNSEMIKGAQATEHSHSGSRTRKWSQGRRVRGRSDGDFRAYAFMEERSLPFLRSSNGVPTALNDTGVPTA